MAEEAHDPERPEIADEDRARADFYALLGRLFYDAPDAPLLAEIGRGPEPHGAAEESAALARAWGEFRAAGKSASPAAVKQEFDTLFVGVGRSPVTPYTSHYVKETSPDRHLVALREQLGAWGLGRREHAFEVEDHVSALCDVMRYLIEEAMPLEVQRSFFEQYVYAGVRGFCDSLLAAETASFYKKVAALARAFLEVEKAAIEMEGASPGPLR